MSDVTPAERALARAVLDVCGGPMLAEAEHNVWRAQMIIDNLEKQGFEVKRKELQ